MSEAFWFQAAGLLAGAIVGSFLATLLIRWPQGRSVIAGRSRCDSCGVALGPRDLVPLLSYAALKGRCRRCGARIDARHIAVEIAAATVGLIALVAHPLPLALVSAGLGLWLLLIAVLDVEHHWLPDRLTLPLLAAGLIAGWVGLGPPLLGRLLGAAIGWAGLALVGWLYLRVRGRDGLGGGDPRLFGALGAWLGAVQLPFVLVGAGLFGLAAIVMMRLRGESVTTTTRLPLGALMALAAWPLWLVVAA